MAENGMLSVFGYRELDEVSELTENQSVTSLDLTSSSDSESSTEDFCFVVEMKECRVAAGQVARFRCQLMGKSALSVMWYHGNKTVENGGRYRVYRQGPKQSMEIYFTTFADAGTVRCQAFCEDFVAETSARLKIRGTENLLDPVKNVSFPQLFSVQKNAE